MLRAAADGEFGRESAGGLPGRDAACLGAAHELRGVLAAPCRAGRGLGAEHRDLSARDGRLCPELESRRTAARLHGLPRRRYKCGFDVWGLVFGECAKRGLDWCIHTTWEESHWISNTESNWNLLHPQYTTRTKHGSPRLASASLAFPEVMAHKLRLVDDMYFKGTR